MAVADAGQVARAPWGPCLLAWAVPGAGHLMVGRPLQAVVFFAVVLFTFFTGLSLGGTVYAMDAEAPLSYLATAANVGTGPVDTVARLATYGALRYRVPDSRTDARGREAVLATVRKRVERQTHAYGRTFLLTAGLMNLLLVLDVFDICIGRKPLRPAAAGQVVAEE